MTFPHPCHIYSSLSWFMLNNFKKHTPHRNPDRWKVKLCQIVWFPEVSIGLHKLTSSDKLHTMGLWLVGRLAHFSSISTNGHDFYQLLDDTVKSTLFCARDQELLSQLLFLSARTPHVCYGELHLNNL